MKEKEVEKTSITASIDLTDETERKLYEHVMSKGPRKKSKYIKRLIYDDMMGLNKHTPVVQEFNENEEDDFEAMNDAF